MSSEGPAEGARGSRRIQDCLGDELLILHGEADDFGFFYRANGGGARGGNHEIGQRAPLDFRGALEE